MSNQAVFSVKQPSDGTMVLGGEVDLSNSPQVKSLLEEWLRKSLPSYTLDLRPLKRIDSSGLGLVVGAYRRAVTQVDPPATFQVRAGGSVLRVLLLIGLDRIFTVIPET